MKFRFVAGDTLDDIRERKIAPAEAVPTPILGWNALCGEEGGGIGLARTWTCVIGGMPGSRKSYLALNMAAHAILEGHRVGAINFEMSFPGYATRFLSVFTGVDREEIGWGERFSDDTWAEARRQVDKHMQETDAGLITNDASVFSTAQIREAYEAFARADVSLVIVDYVQLVKSSGDDLKDRSGNVAELLRTMSHTHDVVTLAVSQINRAGMNKEDKPPRMSDLYGGMFWEANANQVVMLDHTRQRNDYERKTTHTHMILDKNRHGPAPVDVPIVWDWSTMRVEEDLHFGQSEDNIEGPEGVFADAEEVAEAQEELEADLDAHMPF